MGELLAGARRILQGGRTREGVAGEDPNLARRISPEEGGKEATPRKAHEEPRGRMMVGGAAWCLAWMATVEAHRSVARRGPAGSARHSEAPLQGLSSFGSAVGN